MSDIAELFQRDPTSLTKENIDEIISFYRQARANFNLGDKQAGSAKRLAPGPKVDKIDLGDLI
jgi:hypothetical protein